MALLLWLAAVAPVAIAKTPGEVEIGQTLRDATLLGLNGPARRLSEFRGRPLIINVWASWCAPCRQEMASLERLAWQEHPAKFAVIGISTDDYPEKAQRLLKSTNATISHYIDRQLQMENMLGATHLPLTVLIDADGRVRRQGLWGQAVGWPRGLEADRQGVSQSNERSAPLRKRRRADALAPRAHDIGAACERAHCNSARSSLG